jgi:hypothetical protein
MYARTLLAALLVTLPACAGKNKSAGPTTVASTTFKDEPGEVQLEVQYDPMPPDRIALIIHMKGIGIEEMDKIAVDVTFDGFHIFEGSSQWAGFVPVREQRQHSLVLKRRDDVESGTITVTASRFRDSTPLAEEVIPFTFTPTIIEVAD